MLIINTIMEIATRIQRHPIHGTLLTCLGRTGCNMHPYCSATQAALPSSPLDSTCAAHQGSHCVACSPQNSLHLPPLKATAVSSGRSAKSGGRWAGPSGRRTMPAPLSASTPVPAQGPHDPARVQERRPLLNSRDQMTALLGSLAEIPIVIIP